MKRIIDPKDGQEETKKRIPVWMYPSTLAVMDNALEKGNCKSRSEFLDQAAVFYAGYLSGEDACNFLPPAMVSAIRGTLQDSENRTARLLFKLAVEVSIMMNVLASELDISESDIEKLRNRCVREVKRTNGNITFQEAVRYQKGVD